MFKFGAITELPNEYNLPFSICVDRSDLQEVLLEEIQDCGVLQMGTSLLGYRNNTEENGGGVTAFLDDGSKIHADLLIVALMASGARSERRCSMNLLARRAQRVLRVSLAINSILDFQSSDPTTMKMWDILRSWSRSLLCHLS